MCDDTACPMRHVCYRYVAIPSDIQAYADFNAIRGVSAACEAFVNSIEYRPSTQRRVGVADEHNRRMQAAKTVNGENEHEHDHAGELQD